ncbi:multidrug effflux MFS transporter [Pseudomonas oryzihabitans]|nr:multidrug effflux MFS transporter [Pseudomonas oryzihabitans]
MLKSGPHLYGSTMPPSSTGFRFAASLALVAILGPSGIDMYLASLPHMAQDLGAPYTQIQLTLTVFLLAMGAGQLLFGPVIDAYGRRRPLLAGLLVFILASLWAGSSHSIGMLLAARLLQGLAAALTLVVAISTVRDVAEGTRAAQLFALLMTIEGLAPVMAPAVGGLVDAQFGWRAVMLLLAGLGLIAWLNTLFNLPETLPVAKRLPLTPPSVMCGYLRILNDRAFLVPALALAAAFFFLFAYIGGAALVYQKQYGLMPADFGLVFGATGIAVLVGAVFCGRTVEKVGVARMAVIGVTMMVVGASVSAAGAIAGLGLLPVAAGMFIALFGLGIAESTLMSLAMASQKEALGSTAALLGGLQLSIGALATPVAGYLAEQGASEWCIFLACFSLVVLLLARASARRAPTDGIALASH